MARSLKPQKVKEIRDKATDMHHWILLDRNKLTFFAEPAEGVRVEAETAEACEKLLREKFKDLHVYDWAEMIVIDGPLDPEDRDRSYGSRRVDDWIEAKVEFKFRRCERSLHPDRSKERYVQRVHRDDLPENLKKPKNAYDRRDREEWENGLDTEHVYYGDEDLWLPHTPELWARCLRMKKLIEGAAAQLEDLIRAGRKDQALFLREFAGARLLGQGSVVPSRSERKAGLR